MMDPTLLAALLLSIILAASLFGYFEPFSWYTTYLVEDREFSHEAAARDYLASFHDDVPRRVIRRRRLQWRDAP